MEVRRLSRRDFLKIAGIGAGIVAGALFEAGCGHSKIPEYKDREEISYGDGRHVLFNGRTYLRESCRRTQKSLREG